MCDVKVAEVASFSSLFWFYTPKFLLILKIEDIFLFWNCSVLMLCRKHWGHADAHFFAFCSVFSQTQLLSVYLNFSILNIHQGTIVIELLLWYYKTKMTLILAILHVAHMYRCLLTLAFAWCYGVLWDFQNQLLWSQFEVYSGNILYSNLCVVSLHRSSMIES